MKHLKLIASKNRMLIALHISTGIIIAFLNTYSADYYQKLIDRFTAGTLSVQGILLYGLVLAVLCLISYMDEYPYRKLENNLYLDLKILALEKISRMDYLYYQKCGTGRLIQRIENGSAAGKSILFDFIFRIAGELLPSVLFSLFFIGRLNRVILYAVLAGYLFVFLITKLLLTSLYRMKERIMDHEEQIHHILTRGFMEMVVFRINRRFGSEIAKAEKAKTEIVGAKVKMKLIHEAFFAIFSLMVTGVKIGVLLYAWKTGSMTIGAAVALITLVDHSYTPVAIFNVLFVQYKLDCAAYKRYEEFLDAADDRQLTTGEPIPAVTGRIRFQAISFRYTQPMLLDDFNLELSAGEKAAFVGEIGSGKSTVVKLLLGLLKSGAGTIYIDDRKLEQLSLPSLYKHVGYVSQDSPIFGGTLRENLIFDALAEDDLLEQVLRKVCLYDWYSGLENGLDTSLGERGVTLSGGERQRLALARLWFEEKSILILDEATSALDNLTEETVMEAILERFEASTVIQIAHRLNTVRRFDRVIVFRNGGIEGMGSFSDLLETDSYFRQLYEADIKRSLPAETPAY